MTKLGLSVDFRDVLRFEVISLCAKAANFKVTREKQTQDTLSTTVRAASW